MSSGKIMEGVGIKIASNVFELPSYQRRLRHLRSIAVRNLKCQHLSSKDITKLQTYFTLHKNTSCNAFYKSEQIMGSLNPTWQSFDINHHGLEIDTKTQFCVVRVWVGQNDQFHLLIDWQVNLTGLIFHADKLQQENSMKYSTNTIIFGMFDKLFRAPDLLQTSVQVGKEPSGDTKEVPTSMKVDSSARRNSYTSSSLSRIYTVLRAIKQTQATVNKVHRSIEDKLLSSQEKSRKLSTREDLMLTRSQLRNEVTWQTAKLQQVKDDCDKLREGNHKSKTQLDQKYTSLEMEKTHLREKRKSYNQTRESLIKENAQLWIRKKQLIGELATCIYPITEKKKNEFCICDVKLPNSEDFQGNDEIMVGIALGYTCHNVLMISHILDIPLRYPMNHRVSRSQIRDHIHTKLVDKDREFPLYSKGKEKFQFNYGVFLLNKNISQIRFFMGLGTTDLRTTLHNIKTLLELRLGFKSEPTSHMRYLQTGSEGKDKIPSDTQSSLASFGKLSFPDSNDMGLKRNISMADQSIDRSSNADIDDIDFHPGDDNFFKISNPVSEKLDELHNVKVDSFCDTKDHLRGDDIGGAEQRTEEYVSSSANSMKLNNSSQNGDVENESQDQSCHNNIVIVDSEESAWHLGKDSSELLDTVKLKNDPDYSSHKENHIPRDYSVN